MIEADQSSSFEIVTALVRKADYAELKKSGVPRPDQVVMALWHYLRLIEETKLTPGVSDSGIFNFAVTTFPCALPRALCDRVKSLEGRLDLHIMEAVRLWLR